MTCDEPRTVLVHHGFRLPAVIARWVSCRSHHGQTTDPTSLSVGRLGQGGRRPAGLV
jgi:hypothetical protein